MRSAALWMVVLTQSVTTAANAQSASVSGQLLGSLTKSAVPGISACYAAPGNFWRCGRADPTGRFRIDSVPADSGDIVVVCVTLPRGERTLLRRTFRRRPAEDLALTVASAGCDTRVERQVRGVFAGHFSTGFEMSEFVPCLRASWYIPTDTIETFDFRRSAWVMWPRNGDPPGAPKKWPTPKRAYPPWNYRQYYIRFAGVITGPGSYGHLGVAGFAAEIDSILVVRTPSDSDCARLP